MPSPLFNMLGGNTGGNYSPFMRMLQQFQQFRQSFQGDPKAEIEKLLQSGKINQQQLNQVQALAAQFQKML